MEVNRHHRSDRGDEPEDATDLRVRLVVPVGLESTDRDVFALGYRGRAHGEELLLDPVGGIEPVILEGTAGIGQIYVDNRRGRFRAVARRADLIDGAHISRGWAKEPQDGAEGWTLDTRMHVASLSKVVTAIAMTKLLNDAGLSPDTPIIDFLPAYWVTGPGVENLRFFDLLAHQSGLAYKNPNGRTDFAWMKEQIALGTYNQYSGDYQNLNYGLCRILLATVNGDVPVDGVFPGWPGTVDSLWDSATITAYTKYVTDNVFAPSGVTRPRRC